MAAGRDPDGDEPDEKRRADERRSGKERRRSDAGPPAEQGADRRLAERRKGLDRRRQHLHYDALTTHPRPDRNINDYPLSTDEVEFINAINDYKDKFSRPFPTWSEVLHVLRTLGYIRVDVDFPVPSEGGPFDPPKPASGGSEEAKAAAEKGAAEAEKSGGKKG